MEKFEELLEKSFEVSSSPIGSIVTFDGVNEALVISEVDDEKYPCRGCYFDECNVDCEGIVVGSCLRYYRDDNKDVIFKKYENENV